MLTGFQRVSFLLFLASASAWSGSGKDHLEASRGKMLKVSNEVQEVEPRPETWESVKDGTLHCKSNPMKLERVASFVDMPVFSAGNQLWVGNLLRGKDFETGKMTPITIKRAGGTILIKGVKFKDAAAKTEIQLKTMSDSDVESALRKLRSQTVENIEGKTRANIVEVYSPEQAAFQLSFAPATFGDFADVLGVEGAASKNSVVVRFTQLNHTISFEDPETAYSVFLKDEAISDPENQIGKDNPPLYIKDIGYGSALFIVASSEESVESLKAALTDLFGDQKDLEKYRPLLSKTSLRYFVSGGNSATAVKPIQAQSPDLMLEAVKKVVEDEKKRFADGRLGGVPISYSVNYLTTRSSIDIGTAVAYDKRECRIIPNSAYSFTFETTCAAGSIRVSVVDAAGKEQSLDSTAQNAKNNLDALSSTKDENSTLKVVDTKIVDACSFRLSRTHKNPKTDLDETVYLQADGRLGADANDFKMNPSSKLEKKADYQIVFNRNTGEARFIKR